MTADYQDDYKQLASEFDINRGNTPLHLKGHSPIELKTFGFNSSANWVHRDSGHAGAPHENDPGANGLEQPDGMIRENIHFRYPMFVPESVKKSDRFILLLHGLNEGKWDKYLPWAMALAERCQRPVILFPIAFHMNRAPSAWRNPREMRHLADTRKKEAAADMVSFVNAAISHRLQYEPQRFLSSGLHTYYDVLQLLEDIKNGAVPHISGDATPDIFAYSIGAFLAEILLASNSGGHFKDSRLFMFCGGGTLDSSHPVSKTIIDSNAYTALFNWLKGLFKNIEAAGRRAKDLLAQERPEIRYFKSFLFLDRMGTIRESAFKKVGDRIKCLGLAKDQVFPPDAIGKTLSGTVRKSGVDLVTMDFDYAYKHEEPFPMLRNYRSAINDCFNEIFTMASDFFCREA
jgi:hypothetical protein